MTEIKGGEFTQIGDVHRLSEKEYADLTADYNRLLAEVQRLRIKWSEMDRLASEDCERIETLTDAVQELADRTSDLVFWIDAAANDTTASDGLEYSKRRAMSAVTKVFATGGVLRND